MNIWTLVVSREFWSDQPEAAARVLAEWTAEHPNDLWLIAIAPDAHEAGRFLDNRFFGYGGRTVLLVGSPSMSVSMSADDEAPT